MHYTRLGPSRDTHSGNCHGLMAKNSLMPGDVVRKDEMDSCTAQSAQVVWQYPAITCQCLFDLIDTLVDQWYGWREHTPNWHFVHALLTCDTRYWQWQWPSRMIRTRTRTRNTAHDGQLKSPRCTSSNPTNTPCPIAHPRHARLSRYHGNLYRPGWNEETPSNLPHARRRMLWLNPEIQLPITTHNTHMHMHTP